jgi:hypothetical protein
MGVSPSTEADFSDPVLQETTVSDVEVLHYREECIFDQQWLADTYTKGAIPLLTPPPFLCMRPHTSPVFSAE